MKKILILYFSAAGATKKVAEFMKKYLSQNCGEDTVLNIFSVEESERKISTEQGEFFDLSGYDALIVGTPVYHETPSRVLMEYFKSIRPLKKPLPVFIFNTMGLFAGNTNRILAKVLRSKNIFCVMDRQYRAPASDASLLLPSVRRFFKFEKNIRGKIISDCDLFLELLRQDAPKEKRPGFHWGSLVNAPNKLMGKIFRFKIYLNRDSCLKCGKCIRDCPHKILRIDEQGCPIFTKKGCENCYRCVHNCPGRALSLGERPYKI